MKVIMYPAITLDGFIADPSGDCYSWISEEDDAGYIEEMKRCGCDIVGRKTYEQYKDEYDSRTDITTFICTTKSNYEDTDKLKFVHGTPKEILAEVERQGFSEVILSGGGEINGQFAEAGCVDEIIVSIYSLVLGEGIPLFGSHKPKLQLELLSSNEEIKGIIQNHYKVLKGNGS